MFLILTLAVLCLIAVCCAYLGVFLVLSRLSLAGDALGHSIFPGVALAFFIFGTGGFWLALGGGLLGAIVFLGAWWVAQKSRVFYDGALAAFYLISLAGGVLLVNASGSSIDLLHFLFGNILALDEDVALGALIGAGFCLILFIFFSRALLLQCVDAGFASNLPDAKWVKAGYVFFLLALVVNLVAGFYALGTLLVMALLVLPAVIARLWVSTINKMILVGAGVSVSACITGFSIAYLVDISVGPSIVLSLGTIYILSLIFAPFGLQST